MQGGLEGIAAVLHWSPGTLALGKLLLLKEMQAVLRL